MIMSSTSLFLLDFLLSSCLVTLAMATEPPLPPTAESPASNFNNSSPCLHHDHFPHPNQYLNINAVIIAAMLCALLCALGLNSMLQCVLRGIQRILREPVQWAASRRLNSGLKKKDMVALPTSTYADSTRSPPPGDSVSSCACAICLVDFCEGDKIRVLPECHHRFHVACIDEWLLSHSSCPTCRRQLKSINCASLPCLHMVTAL